MVRQRQLRFLGHALRMPVGEPCRTYALYVPTHGKRRPGRQRLDYLGYVRNLLGDTEGDLRPEDIANLAADRRSLTACTVTRAITPAVIPRRHCCATPNLMR
ncbi:hypothetical protein Bbelb_067260 [Branchiostoma belcheri]|nr:hypothetical protein Bbelb_067260 [Branchiostoma belcheri]